MVVILVILYTKSITICRVGCRLLDSSQGWKGLENGADTSGKESGETRPPEEVLDDQSNTVVAIVIKYKSLSFVLPSSTKPLTRHGVDYEETRDRNGWSFSTEMMGAMLSKFSRVGQIRLFKGVVVQDNQDMEECDHFSDESDTFYSEIYNYDNIVTIENDSN